MKPIYVVTVAGQFVNAQQIVTLDVEGSGVEEQLRHTVYATLVNGDRQSLISFKGTGSHGHAQAFLGDLIARSGAEVFNPELPS